MHLVVLSSPTSWHYRDLSRAAGEGPVQLTAASFSRIWAGLPRHEECAPVVLMDTQGRPHKQGLDAVLVRTMPPGSLEQVVFRMDALARLEAAGTTVVNRPRALEAAVDKYVALAKLADAGCRVPRTVVCQTADDAMQGFDRLGGDVVVKPLFGGEGRGIFRVSDPDLAQRAFRSLEQISSVVYLQRFIDHEGYDLRLFVLGDHVLAMRRQNSADWRTNVSRGAATAPAKVSAPQRELALRAARCVGATMAGVDVLPGRDGNDYVLEVNAVPGWRALSQTLDIDVAAMILEHVATLARRSGEA